MSKLQPEISTDFAWTADELSAYHEQYRRVARADSLLAKAAINAIALEDSNGRPLLDQFDSGILFGVGGVPRGAGIILPTLRETATITLSDNTHQNVESTREIMRQITHNNSKQAHWGLHEKDMETHDERWERAIGKAALIAKFEVIDLREVNESLADVSGMEYVTDSMLEDREDYVATMRNFTTSAREMIYMAYMVGSKGYKVGNKHHPAYAVSVDEAADLIEKGGFDIIHDPHEAFVSQLPGVRQEDDPHPYDGMGVIVAVRK